MLKEISENSDFETISDKGIACISNSISNEEDSEYINDIKESLNKKKSFIWDKNSCAFDSFISIINIANNARTY